MRRLSYNIATSHVNEHTLHSALLSSTDMYLLSDSSVVHKHIVIICHALIIYYTGEEAS